MYKYKFVPVIVGLFLGIIPIVNYHTPSTVGQFSTMASIASPIGYVLSIFVIAWIYKENWKRSFFASFLTMTTAFLTFYLTVHPLNTLIFQIRPRRILLIGIQFPPEAFTICWSLVYFVLWTATFVVVCAIAATVVRTILVSKSKMLKLGVLITSYAGLLGLLYYHVGRYVIGWYWATSRGDRLFTPLIFAGHLFEVTVPLVLMTIFFGIGLKSIIKGDVK